MSIRFILHTSLKDYLVRIFKIRKGDKILKICFDEKDVHVSRSGVMHLDIFGKKLNKLTESLFEVWFENRKKKRKRK